MSSRHSTCQSDIKASRSSTSTTYGIEIVHCNLIYCSKRLQVPESLLLLKHSLESLDCILCLEIPNFKDTSLLGRSMTERMVMRGWRDGPRRVMMRHADIIMGIAAISPGHDTISPNFH